MLISKNTLKNSIYYLLIIFDIMNLHIHSIYPYNKLYIYYNSQYLINSYWIIIKYKMYYLIYSYIQNTHTDKINLLFD